MTKTEFVEKLRVVGACIPAKEWVLSARGTPEELWHKCRKGHWMAWLVMADLSSKGYEIRVIAMDLCGCADIYEDDVWSDEESAELADEVRNLYTWEDTIWILNDEVRRIASVLAQ